MDTLYQSLVAVEPFTLVVTILNLFLQLFLIKKFLLDKVLAVLEQRRQQADARIADAETAKQEAYNGEYTIEGDGQPEPEAPSGDDSYVWDELDSAYQAGYDEGYTEGVNSAYDQ